MFFVSTVQSYDNPFSLTTRKLLFLYFHFFQSIFIFRLQSRSPDDDMVGNEIP